MIAWGRRVRGLRKTNRRMRGELGLLRSMVGQDRKLLEHKKVLVQEMDQRISANQTVWREHRDNLERRINELLERLERVPRWVRWLFKAL